MTHSGNRYEIRTIADIATLRPEQRAGFLKDLEGWLNAIDALRDAAAEMGIKGSPDTSVMTWFDDGDWGTLKEIKLKGYSKESGA